MSKKKRLFGLFAIMFVAIFSVGCVFATACKKNKNKDEESEPEHVHAYTELKYDDEYHWYECATDGAVDESTKVKHEFDNGTVTTEATCGAAGVTTYKCACGYSYTEAAPAATGEHTYDKAVFEWAEDYSSAMASLVCSVCGDVKYTGVEATVTSTSDDEKTTYTATVTFEEGMTKTETKEVPIEKVPEPVKYTQTHTYDFNDEGTYAYFITVNDDGTIGSSEGETEFSSGIFTYKAVQISGNTASKILSVTVDGAAVNSMTTGAKSTSSHAYIELDFSEYAGENVKIETTFSSNKGDGTDNRSMYVSTETCDPVNTSDKSCLLTSATSNTQTNLVTLTYEDVIGTSNSKLYLLCSANVCIFSIAVSLTGDADPWENEGATTPEAHTHTYDGATAQWSWEADETSTTGYAATATIKCTDENCPDDEKGALTGSVEATVTNTTSSTCTTAGSVSLSATVTLNSSTYSSTGSVALPLADHTYPAEGDENYGTLVVWGWDNRNEESGTVTLTVKCSVCGAGLINQDVTYTSITSNDGSKTLTASFLVSGMEITYTDTYTVPVPEIELANRVVAIPQGEQISYKASDAENAANFSNASTIQVAFGESTNTFALSGAASTMSADQAAAFWPGTAAEGDAYVIIGVYSNVGETITFTSSDKDKSFTKTNYEDDLAVIIRITDISKTVTFTVTDNETQQEKASFTVSFAGIDIPQKADSAESIQNMIDEAAEEAGEAGVNASVAITLADNISGSITIKSGTDVTLDLAGYTITGNSTVDENSGTPYTIIVEAGATLTIVDGTGEGSVKCTYAATNNENSRLGAAVYVNGGDLIIEGGTIESSSVGVLAEAGTVKMEGGTISSTYYTLWLARGKVTAYVGGDAVITGERGIFVAGDCKYGYDDYSTDGTCVTTLCVYGNAEISATYGSAISTLGLSNKKTVYVYILGGTINGREVKTDDDDAEDTTPMPAIYMPNGNLYIYGGTITGTTAVEMRGGTLVIGGGELVCTAGTQYTNYATSNASTYGYALAVYPYLITVRDGENGFDNSLEVTVTGGTFTGKIFNWSVDKGAEDEDYEYEFSITGGLFSEDPSAYIDEKYKAALSSVTGYEGYYEVYEYYVVSVEISDETLSLEYDANSEAEDEAELTLTITMSDGTVLESFAGTITWTVTGNAVEIVGNGLSVQVKAIAAGEATITVTVEGWTGTFTCSVTVTEVEAEGEKTYTYSFSELEGKMKEAWAENPVYKLEYEVDADGKTTNTPKTDENGNYVYATDENGEMIPDYDQFELEPEFFETESNSFLTFTKASSSSSSDTYRTASNGCIEIKNGTLSVTFTGAGTIEMGFMSTGSSNYSNMGFMDGSGYYLKGEVMVYDGYATAREVALDNDAGYVYGVIGTTAAYVKFTVEAAGTYTFHMNIADPLALSKSTDGTDKTANAAPGRGTRIRSIVMVDGISVEEEEEEVISIVGTWTGEIEFEITGVKNVLKEALGNLGSLLGYLLEDEYTITATATLEITEDGEFELTLTNYGCDAKAGSTDIGEIIVGILEDILGEELWIEGTWSWTEEAGYVAHMEDDDLGEFDIPVTVTNVEGVDTLCISADVELNLDELGIGFVIDDQTATRADD